ncbi:MAG: putative porin [Chthoniobacterales bacterium]|nr:putative porin [Chthoniobacterales bacterium]
MFNKTMLIAVAGSLLFGSALARAQDNGALLELLVKKGLINDQEAEEVRADLTRDNASTSAGKLKLSTPLTELEIYGDARVRYEVRNGETARPDTINSPGDTFQRNRARYRLRLGLRGTLVDDWFFGIRLETSTSPRSTNVTFADDSSAGGPFSKDSDRISVGQAYLGYTGIRDLTLIAGKMANPFVTSSMVWDGDINPEGLAEQFKHTFNFSFGGGGSSGGVESYSKDGTTVTSAATTSEPQKISVDLYATFGQFVYDDTNPENPIGPNPTGLPENDSYLLGWQVGAKINFPHNFYFQLSPTLYNYTGTGDTFASRFVGDPAFRVIDPVTGVVTTITPNQTGANNLLVFDLPMEIGWKFGELPVKIFGEYARNFSGDDRAISAGHPDKTDSVNAYQIGAGLGKVKEKGSWELRGFWQHAEQFALDPNLVDSDIFDSRVNMEGFAFVFGYALSDAVVANLTYAHGWPIDSDLGTGGVGDIGINPVDDYDILQADLSFKF